MKSRGKGNTNGLSLRQRHPTCQMENISLRSVVVNPANGSVSRRFVCVSRFLNRPLTQASRFFFLQPYRIVLPLGTNIMISGCGPMVARHIVMIACRLVLFADTGESALLGAYPKMVGTPCLK